jgi:hypothetical protein
MHRTIKLLAAFALCAMTSLPVAAASKTRSAPDNAEANLGIITPDVATSVIVADYFTVFSGSGEFALCSDGKVNSWDCVPKTYLTPAKFVAKFYPKAEYIGFKLLMNPQSASDTYLYLYIRTRPQPDAVVKP